jgi:hypothetical protein
VEMNQIPTIRTTRAPPIIISSFLFDWTQASERLVAEAGTCGCAVNVDAMKNPERFREVPPARLEHATLGLGNRCSIQLSYGGRTREITPTNGRKSI